jgi:hypothetical protein
VMGDGWGGCYRSGTTDWGWPVDAEGRCDADVRID